MVIDALTGEVISNTLTLSELAYELACMDEHDSLNREISAVYMTLFKSIQE